MSQVFQPEPNDVLAALALPTSGRVYSLAMLMNNDHPLWPMHGPFLHFNIHSYVQGGRRATGTGGTPGLGMLVDRVEMPLHVGTHMDALNHIAVDNHLYGGYSASEVESSAGADVLGIETVVPFICRGLLLDIAKLHGVDTLAADHEVTPDDIEQAMYRQGIDAIHRGDMVIIHSGWMKHYETNRRHYFMSEPGIGVTGAQFLANAGVRGVGSDVSALELVPSGVPDRPYPVHEELLPRRGVHLFENMVSSELANDDVSEFLFVAAPLLVRGGTGSPLTPLAIV